MGSLPISAITKACNVMINEAFAGQKCVRRHVTMELCAGHAVKKLHVLLTAAPFTYQGHERTVLIIEDLTGLVAPKRGLPHYPS